MRKTSKIPTVVPRLIVTIAAILLAGWLAPSLGQKDDFADYQLRVHCDDPQVATAIFSVKGTGMMGMQVLCAGKCDGSTTIIDDALAGLPTHVADGMRVQLQKHEEKAAAGNAASISCALKCSEKYTDYLRKREVAMDLYKHASELRLKATKLVAERWGAESENLRIEGEKDIALDQGYDKFGQHVLKGMRGSRSALSEMRAARIAVANAPFAVKAWNAIGWIDLAVQTAHRSWVTAGDYADYQKEAQDATKKAEQLWREALEDFEAHIKQTFLCLEESRAAAAKAALEEAKLEKAKAAIEEWDNNQTLYWDPIKNEAVTYREALNRAKNYLKSGRISAWPGMRQPLFSSFVATDDEPSQEALTGAIRELDIAIPSFDRFNTQVSKYFQAQRSIEQKLEAAFGTGAGSSPGLPTKKPAVTKPKSTKRPA